MDDAAILDAVHRNIEGSVQDCICGLPEVASSNAPTDHAVDYRAKSSGRSRLLRGANHDSWHHVEGAIVVESKTALSAGQALALSAEGVTQNVAAAIASNILADRKGGVIETHRRRDSRYSTR